MIEDGCVRIVNSRSQRVAIVNASLTITSSRSVARDLACTKTAAAVSSDALAFRPDQNSRHVVRDVARFCQRRVRSMPFRMTGVVPGGAPLAMIALPAAGA